MENKIVRIPVDGSKFDNEKINKSTLFLNDFFCNEYECSFIYDNQDLCLQIFKNN